MPFQIECLSDTITFLFFVMQTLFLRHAFSNFITIPFSNTQTDVLESTSIISSFARKRDIFISENTHYFCRGGGKSISNINFYLVQRNSADWFVSFRSFSLSLFVWKNSSRSQVVLSEWTNERFSHRTISPGSAIIFLALLSLFEINF